MMALACSDIRWESNRDLQGDIESGISRSADAGKKWDPMHVVLSMDGDGELLRHFNGVSDACLLVDAKGDRIFVIGAYATAMETSALIFPQPDGIGNTSNKTDERVQGLVQYPKRVRNFS